MTASNFRIFEAIIYILHATKISMEEALFHQLARDDKTNTSPIQNQKSRPRYNGCVIIFHIIQVIQIKVRKNLQYSQ